MNLCEGGCSDRVAISVTPCSSAATLALLHSHLPAAVIPNKTTPPHLSTAEPSNVSVGVAYTTTSLRPSTSNWCSLIIAWGDHSNGLQLLLYYHTILASECEAKEAKAEFF